MFDLIDDLAVRPVVRQVIAGWALRGADVIDEAITLQQIPAPTFDEADRAYYVRDRFRALNLADIEIDALYNVYARTPGSDPQAPAVVVSAHLDTVFPAGTDLAISRDSAAGRISGPGLGDNSMGVAAMLALAEALRNAGYQPPTDMYWVATVGEEGNGDLRGMRGAMRKLKGRAGQIIVLEGIGVSRVYNAGLGVRRLEVAVTGPGGHSWLHAERPSAIHHLLQIGAELVETVALSNDPRATLNVGLINGGRSINTRAPDASMSIDLRSEDAATLSDLERAVRQVIQRYAHTPGLTVTTKVIGDRPSAHLADDHPLVQAALTTLQYLGFEQVVPERGSTDANIPLALGIPSVCVGITTGGNAHSIDEYIDSRAVYVGMTQLTLLTLMAAEHAHDWADWNARTRGTRSADVTKL